MPRPEARRIIEPLPLGAARGSATADRVLDDPAAGLLARDLSTRDIATVFTATDAGVERFTAEVLPHNRRMLNLFHSSGLQVTARFQDGVVHVRSLNA